MLAATSNPTVTFLLGVVYAALGAAGYATSAYMKRREEGEEFEPKKWLATVIVGSGIGVAIYVAPGQTLTAETVYAQLAVYAGLVVLVENVIKVVSARIDRAPELLEPRELW